MAPPPPVDPSVITDAGGKYIRTADNRVVEYSVHGNLTNPDAPVLVMAYVADYLLDVDDSAPVFDYGDMKAITVSIPGLGHSDFHPGHVIAEWPETDLLPILDKEKVDSFLVWGNSLGTLYAMAIAQYFGEKRVQALGLRVPFLPLPISQDAALVQGQPTLPTTLELEQNTLKVKIYRSLLQLAVSAVNPSPFMQKLMKLGLLGANLQSIARFMDDYPALASYLQRMMKYFGAESMLYAVAKDVALDCPNLDPRQIQLDPNHIVVWYATDDDDCPPSHGKWLVEECFAGCRNRAMTGYGHVGGAFLEMATFFDELQACSKR